MAQSQGGRNCAVTAEALEAVRRYLDERINGEPRWMLAKEVAADLGLNSRLVGGCFGMMAVGDPVFSVEAWSYRHATRWRVERK